MGSHSDSVAIAAAIHNTTFAASVSYTSPGGTVQPVAAILYPARTERRESSIGVIEVDVREVIVTATELANPVILSVFTIDSQSWTVEKIEKTTSNRWKISLTQTDAVEMNRSKYRRGAR